MATALIETDKILRYRSRRYEIPSILASSNVGKEGRKLFSSPSRVEVCFFLAIIIIANLLLFFFLRGLLDGKSGDERFFFVLKIRYLTV